MCLNGNAWLLVSLSSAAMGILVRRQLTLMSSVASKPTGYQNLLPLPSTGTYRVDGTTHTACFLGPERMVCQDVDQGGCIGRGLIPVPIPVGFESTLFASTNVGSKANAATPRGHLITERNNGIYDNLQPAARRCVYEFQRANSYLASTYEGFVAALRAKGGLTISGLLIELADEPAPGVVILGAAALLAQNDIAGSWRLTASRLKPLRAIRTVQTAVAQLVKCTMDEAVGLALATDLPVVISDQLYATAAVDALLLQDPSTGRIEVSAPYKSRSSAPPPPLATISAYTTEKPAPKAMDIPDATAYLTMTTAEKRAVLRATGIVGMALPRPREGPAAVDALLIPLLDEEVAYEVLRRLGETKGDFAAAARMSDFESRKPFLAQQIRLARQRGDLTLAKVLCDELNSLSTLRFNPINPSAGTGDEWDLEEWYWEQRKKAYGIIAA